MGQLFNCQIDIHKAGQWCNLYFNIIIAKYWALSFLSSRTTLIFLIKNCSVMMAMGCFALEPRLFNLFHHINWKAKNQIFSNQTSTHLHLYSTLTKLESKVFQHKAEFKVFHHSKFKVSMQSYTLYFHFYLFISNNFL